MGVSAAAQLATVYVPALREAFGTQTLTLPQLAVVLILSSTAFIAVEFEKALRRRAAPSA